MKHFKLVVDSSGADAGTYIARRIVLYDDNDRAILSTSADHVAEMSVVDPNAPTANAPAASEPTPVLTQENKAALGISGANPTPRLPAGAEGGTKTATDTSGS